ncbi:D-inositol-3-phosphate glycosyltransferase [Usitatibacter rugosus]|uniref:D-inositol-3-phosphate glycosyltransferase n=1 Tax=Usitatibacter rugosus TaxID=2732067 RepID=A0A6M4GVM8_9PROT|nr:glycosyltransferase [Usitatibacter rugosus]QJR10393.1 D-inositol-3-phosphate glycosyltransferase [Usitatibacter rugosus]
MDGAVLPLAAAVPGLLPVDDARGVLRVLIASLAPGGAERIVIEWLAAEAERGREIELAVLHGRRHALAPPAAIRVRTRGRESPEDFLDALASDWRGGPPVSVHLVTDVLLARLWTAGVRTVPTVHNAREGWRNDPASWTEANVPRAVACAQRVQDEMRAAGCRVPIVTIRHRPGVPPSACDPAVRREIRAALALPPGAFVIAAVGALKAQKDHARAVEVLVEVARSRDAYLVVLGGVLEPRGFEVLDEVLDAALERGVTARLRLPGWVDSIAPYLAASDALLNTSRFEGLSIAAQEALAAGLPVVATDVGGQSEIHHAGLQLLPARASVREFAARLAVLPVRERLQPSPFARAPRAASLSLTHRERPVAPIDTLFVTANLNAGGAQRSLVNLVRTLRADRVRERHAFAVAVCGESTHSAFAMELMSAGVDCFRATLDRDDAAIAESLLAQAARRGARTLCFWNAAPGVKLLVAKFAPPALRIVDVSPGAYAFEELDDCDAVARAHDFDALAYYRRLNALVLKHDAATHPPCRRVAVIPNGVARAPATSPVPETPRFLVNGRIAPSKRLEVVIEALRHVSQRHADVELHIVGPVEPRHAEYGSRIASLAQGLPVHFRSADFDLACLAEPWTAIVVLGTHQGSPNAVLEAMSAGIPVIANASGGTGEVVRDGDTGWLLAEDVSAGDLAQAMLAAMADLGEGRRRAARAQSRVHSDHSLEAMVAAYVAVLEEGSGHEKMAPWNSASAPVAPPSSPGVPLPTMPG